MNESEERSSAEEEGPSPNAGSSVGEHEPFNITDSSVMMVEKDSLKSSVLGEGQEEIKDTSVLEEGQEEVKDTSVLEEGQEEVKNTSVLQEGQEEVENTSVLEEGQEKVKDKLLNNGVCSMDLEKHESVNAENIISHCEEEPLIEGEMSDGGSTASLKDFKMADGFDNEHNNDEEGNSVSATAKHNLYEELKILDECKIVENKDDLKCEFCLNVCEPKAGVILTECIHSFCKECIKKIVETSDDVEIKCPFRDLEFSCDTILPHRIIKEICGAVTFEKFLDRSLSVAGCSKENPMPIEKVEKRVIDTALYEELVHLDDQLLVENQEAFVCEVCLMTCEPKAGAIIAECLHAFCKQCIATLVNMTNDVEIHCPYRDNDYSCDNVILHRELKQIVCQEVFDKFLEKSVSIAMRSMSDVRNCQFPDCKGWIFIDDDDDDGNDTFTCSVCKRINCVLCKGLHDPRVLSCEQYERTLKNPNQFSETFLRDMVNTREAMLCPSCGIVIKKVDGCDGIVCSQCKTEICWATRGPRWGPRGVGDTSGGCQCKKNGIKCHPDCRNCH